MAQDFFGTSVDIYEEFVASGSPGCDSAGSNAGAVYLYEQVGVSWTASVKLLARDGHAESYFGNSISMHAENLIVGVFADDSNGENSGTVPFYNVFIYIHAYIHTSLWCRCSLYIHLAQWRGQMVTNR